MIAGIPPPSLEPWQRDAMRAAAAACRGLLGVGPARRQWPPTRPDRLRVELADGRSVIARRREPGPQAGLEPEILGVLAAARLPVPAVLAGGDDWLIQEHIEGPRLAQALAAVERAGSDGERQGRALLERAVEGLAAARGAVEAAGLAHRVPIIGSDRDHVMPLIEGPARLGERLGMPAPAPRTLRLVRALRVETPRFVRWDNRCTDAVVRGDGAVVWLSWSGCARRHGLDDLVQLMIDEYLPHWPDVEPGLLERHGEALAPGVDGAAAAEYLAVAGCLRSAHRVLRILGVKADRPWQAAEHCLALGQLGVSPVYLGRLCVRAARWAGSTSLTSELSPWFEALATRFAEEQARLEAAAEDVLHSDGMMADALAGLSDAPPPPQASPRAREPGSALDAEARRADGLDREGRHGEAAQAWYRAVTLGADDGGTWLRLALSLHRAGAEELAIKAYGASLERNPAESGAWGNLATLLRRRGALEPAGHAIGKALALRPDDARLHANLGNLLLEKGDLEDARGAYGEALRLAPDLEEARRGLASLEAGEGADPSAAPGPGPETGPIPEPEGGSACEPEPDPAAEPKPEPSAVPEPEPEPEPEPGPHADLEAAPGPEAKGEPLSVDSASLDPGLVESGPEPALPAWDGTALGKRQRLLVWTGQGAAGQLLLGTMLPDIAARIGRGRITVECDPRLLPVYSRGFETLRFEAPGSVRRSDRAFDLQAGFGDLPALFRRGAADFPRRKGFLRPDSDRIAELGARLLLRARGRRLVGLSWRAEGAPGLEAWLPVLRVGGCRFVCLETADAADEVAALHEAHGLELPGESPVDPEGDLDGLASLVAALDLTLTVGDLVAHLAGAIGAPAWLVLSARPSRPWPEKGDSSLWHRSLRLFRQESGGDWAPVIARIAGQLQAWAGQA